MIELRVMNGTFNCTSENSEQCAKHETLFWKLFLLEIVFVWFSFFNRVILLGWQDSRHHGAQRRFFQSSLNPFDDTFVVPTFYISSSSSFWKKALMQLITQWANLYIIWVINNHVKDSLGFYNLKKKHFTHSCRN